MNLFRVLYLDACPIRNHFFGFKSHFFDLVVAVALDFLPTFDYSKIRLKYVWTEALSVQDFFQIFEEDILRKLLCNTPSLVVIEIPVLNLLLNVDSFAVACSVLLEVCLCILCEFLFIEVF